MHFKLFTLYPQMFPGNLAYSLAGKALQNNLWSFEAINIRDYSQDKNKIVDDAPYGGGAGMVMKPDVIANAFDAKLAQNDKIVYMSPRGEIFNQEIARQLSTQKNIAILCGRYEGVDERIFLEYKVQEISIGDYILSGGEPAALVLMDSCIRLLPDVIGNKESLIEESFGQNADNAGLLEYPLYTRPSNWRNHQVPEILVSGDHAKIKKWRLEKSLELTKLRRKDLYNKDLYNKFIENSA